MVGNLGAGAAGGAVVAIVIKAIDEFSDVAKSAENAFKSLGKQMMAAGAIMTAAGTAGILAFGSMAKEAAKFETQQNKLAHILKTSRGASEEQIEVLFDQARALQKVGVVNEEVITSAQAQLATFDLQSESIGALTPAFLDYLVAEKGVNATTGDAIALANGLAQALNGQFASLTRTGFVLTEEQKLLLSTGTETEKITALTDILNSTYEGMNKVAGETSEGALVRLQNSFSSLRKEIGEAVLPIFLKIIEKLQILVDWFNGLTDGQKKTIAIAGLLVAGLLVLFGVILMIAGAIMVLNAAGGIMAIVFAPITLIVLAIIALIAIIVALILNWGKITEWISQLWENFKEIIVSWWGKLKDVYNWIKEKFLDIIEKVWDVLKKINEYSPMGLLSKAAKFLSESEAEEVGDFIITKQGKLIETDPQDTIIGMKDFGGKGTTIVINGDNYGINSDAIADSIYKKITKKISI